MNTTRAEFIVPSNCKPHFPVKLGTGLFGMKVYLSRFAGSGLVAALKVPDFPKSVRSSLRCQYPNKSSGKFLSLIS